jgi:ribosomal protein S25
MNKYKVKITHVFSEVLDVEAANEEEAKDKAKLELEKEDRDAAPQYETTLPMEHWPVISEEKYNELVKEVQSNIITPNIIIP